MSDDPGPDPDAARARLQGKRVALVLVIVVAVAFIGASAVQIVPAVFGAGVTPLPAAPPGSTARACADGVRTLLQQLGSEAAEHEPDEHWDRTARSCQGSPEGLDAWAALMRLRSAQRQTSGQRVEHSELAPLFRDVTAHLPPDLR
jgi:hypothetical protein